MLSVMSQRNTKYYAISLFVESEKKIQNSKANGHKLNIMRKPQEKIFEGQKEKTQCQN